MHNGNLNNSNRKINSSEIFRKSTLLTINFEKIVIVKQFIIRNIIRK